MSQGRIRAGSEAERVGPVIVPLLGVRIAEGLGGWIYFNEFFLAATPSPWLVQASFILYLLVNLVTALLLRRGQRSGGLLAVDVVANAAFLGLPAAQSGGLSSPLLLLLPIKTIAYGIVFSSGAALAYLGASAAMLVALGFAHGAGLFPIVPFSALLPAAAERAQRIAYLVAVVGAPLVLWWLWREKGRVHAGSPAATPPFLERDRTDAVVANALLGVSEAVSRLTGIDEILERVAEIVPASVDVDYCGIALWSEENRTYEGAAAAGGGPTSDRRFAGARFLPEEAPDFEWVRRLGHCAVVPASDTLQAGPLDAPAVLIAPLRSGDRFYGVMELVRRHARPFHQRDMRIADGIARQTGVALERARLVETSRRLVLALESFDAAFLITDAVGRVSFVNPAFARTFGFQPEEIVGREVRDLAGDGNDWIEELSEAVRHRSWRGETVAHRSDGTPIPVVIDTSPMRDDDGRVQGAVTIIEDVSEERELQGQMQRAERLAAVGQMAAGIAHEINNALAVIFGQTVKARASADVDLAEVVAEVDAQARRIADILRGIVGFARPASPSVELVDVSAVVAGTLGLVQHDLARQGIALETESDPELPPARADPRQLQQVLLNLFTNARHAMESSPQKNLRVSVRARGEEVQVDVEDSGPGIPQAILPRIFDPFFSTKPEGSGLGLSVSYAIAEAHGGDLRVTSRPGGGATFTLVLPADRVESAGAVGRVLLVDDDPEVAEAIAAMLVREGADVSRAATGQEALDLLESEAWDAIFLDVRLPDISGPEVQAQIEHLRPDLARRVAFVTGGLWRAESGLRLKLPAQPTLAKPCTQEDLREVLRQLRVRREAA